MKTIPPHMVRATPTKPFEIRFYYTAVGEDWHSFGLAYDNPILAERRVRKLNKQLTPKQRAEGAHYGIHSAPFYLNRTMPEPTGELEGIG